MNQKKIVAFCTTKVQFPDRVSIIKNLYQALDKNKYKIIVVNSPDDFYSEHSSNSGAAASFDILNFEKIDYLIINKFHFKSDVIFNNIITRAKSKSTKVIVYNDKIEGCYNIIPNYNSAYKTLINHLIHCHQYNDFFFINGIKGEEESERRLKIYKEALEENNVKFDNNKTAYGQYYENAVYQIFNDLKAKGSLPQVFICTNDTMALAIYKKAEENGLKVPDDIAVIGFDNLVYSSFISPPLSTCGNEESFNSSYCLYAKIINQIENHNIEPGIIDDTYQPIIRGSCGCLATNLQSSNNNIDNAFRNFEKVLVYESNGYDCIERAMSFDFKMNIYESLIQCAIPDSFICIKNDFSVIMSNLSSNENSVPEELYVLSSQKSIGSDSIRNQFKFLDMIPDYNDWVNGDSIYLISAIYSGESVCGYYMVKTQNIQECANYFNITNRTINIIMTEALARYRQKSIISQNIQLLNINPITNLPNLKGLRDWFNEFSNRFESHKKYVMVSLYWIPRYKEIYEKYGVEESEQIVGYIGETLKIANSHHSYISQIADDEFVVVNYVSADTDVPKTINNATKVFYGLRENYIKEKQTQYQKFELEVNCGCTVLDAGWPNNIGIIELVKLARTEMFMNRFKYNNKEIANFSLTAKEDYHALMLLTGRNLFKYYYQPIIDVNNKSIYGYEALMRTDAEINMSPVDILATAASYSKLYDVERATVFNVMEDYFQGKKEKFYSRKVFINSIPGYFLEEKDIEEVRNRYIDLFDSFVFEITEQSAASDEEVQQIKTLGNSEKLMPIAIDDYGSGSSNIVNLMRYSPQIIKIDRLLITNIDKDTNKQMFVKGTIDFAKANNIKVLAEGVETKDEFLEVIKLGVDYVQGYYTGKPSETPLKNIPDTILCNM